MTALPPTLGHLRLIQFSHELAETRVIVCTQPDEPYPQLRYEAIERSVPDGVTVYWFDEEIEQNPEADGFWDMWREIMESYGFEAGDYVVASESYGSRLADEIGGVFMPYDLNRDVTPVKATRVRNSPIERFHEMIPEFRKDFVSRVTIFGAESTGKSTLSEELAVHYNAYWLFEWARPFLETVGPEITTDKMVKIWQGQKALQYSATYLDDSPLIIQDTDLFSTVGYWDMWDQHTPPRLVVDAALAQSDLYLITRSNIPFEPDPLRYGGDVRESDDQYWIDLCEANNLNYRVLTSDTLEGRVKEASHYIDVQLESKLYMKYERSHNDHTN